MPAFNWTTGIPAVAAQAKREAVAKLRRARTLFKRASNEKRQG
jgi:hypothetical protein